MLFLAWFVLVCVCIIDNVGLGGFRGVYASKNTKGYILEKTHFSHHFTLTDLAVRD